MGQTQHDAGLDWQNDAGSGGTRHKFGPLKILVNKIKTQAGAKYALPGILGKEGQPYEFKGKQLAADGDKTHVILVLEAVNKDGQTYHAIRDGVSFDPTIIKARAALIDVMGQNFYGDYFAGGKSVEVEIEEMPTGEKTNTDKDKTTFKVLRVFKSRDERMTAEKEYFSKFGGNANGHSSGIPADVLANAKILWQALAGNEAMFSQVASQDAKLSAVTADKLLEAVKA